MIGILRNFLSSFAQKDYLLILVINLKGIIAMLDVFERSLDLDNNSHYVIVALDGGGYTVEINCTHKAYLKMMRELQAKNLNLREENRKGKYSHSLVDLK